MPLLKKWILTLPIIIGVVISYELPEPWAFVLSLLSYLVFYILVDVWFVEKK